MAAGRSHYLVRFTKVSAGVLVETTIDGTPQPSRTLREATAQAIRTEMQSVVRAAKSQAASRNVDVDAEVVNVINRKVMKFTATPAGDTTEKRTEALTDVPAAPTASPASEPQTAPRRNRATGAHRAPASGFGYAPPARQPQPRPQVIEPLRRPEPEPEPEVVWADSESNTDLSKAEDKAPVELVPVTDKKLRIKKKANDEDESATANLINRFKALTLVKKVLVILAVLIVAFLGLRIFGGGSGEYTAICVDQRTGMRNLDPAPCATGTVRFFLWYYVESGESLPEPGTDYTTAPGTFDKPTSGKITYP